jgi:Lon protease-like protein
MHSRTLPIFPLPLVLFPGTLQPLHIFEPRYRQMLSDCQEGDGCFGLAYVRATPYTDPSPSPGAVGCSAHVESVQPLPDGRYNIMSLGQERFLLREFVETDRLYRVAVVEPFTDEPWDRDEVAERAAGVRAAFETFAQAVSELTQLPETRVELPEDPSQLSFHVAAALDIEPREKQGLLELRSVSDRLRRLATTLGRLQREVKKRAAMQRRTKGNGKRDRGDMDLRE